MLASCVCTTGHHMWAVSWTEGQTGTAPHPESAERNFLHAPENVKGSGLPMASETASENVMQLRGVFLTVTNPLGCLFALKHTLFFVGIMTNGYQPES